MKKIISAWRGEESAVLSSWSYLDRIVAEPLSVSAISGQRSGGERRAAMVSWNNQRKERKNRTSKDVWRAVQNKRSGRVRLRRRTKRMTLSKVQYFYYRSILMRSTMPCSHYYSPRASQLPSQIFQEQNTNCRNPNIQNKWHVGRTLVCFKIKLWVDRTCGRRAADTEIICVAIKSWSTEEPTGDKPEFG